MKYINQLRDIELIDLAKRLGFEFFSDSSCSGTNVIHSPNCVFVKTYEGDHYNFIQFTDYQILDISVTDKVCPISEEAKAMFRREMSERFGQDYKNDYIKYYYQKLQNLHERLQQNGNINDLKDATQTKIDMYAILK